MINFCGDYEWVDDLGTVSEIDRAAVWLRQEGFKAHLDLRETTSLHHAQIKTAG